MYVCNQGYSSEKHSPGGIASFLLGNDILRKPTLIRAISSINRWPNGQIPYKIASNFSTFPLAKYYFNFHKILIYYHTYNLRY